MAIYHLEEWFRLNAPSIGAIALRLARYHIARALPEPGDHLKRADQMLRLARGATPGDRAAHEIFNEFSQVNAALQEQVIRAGNEVIAWNSAMGQGANARGEWLLPLIVTFRKVADYCFEKGFPRLTPLFAERAAELARQSGAPLCSGASVGPPTRCYIHQGMGNAPLRQTGAPGKRFSANELQNATDLGKEFVAET